MYHTFFLQGLAGYSAVKQSELRSGEWVIVVGAGGGLGHYGQLPIKIPLNRFIYNDVSFIVVLFARLTGARVLAIDSGEAKAGLMRTLGADAFVDYKQEEDLMAAVIKKTDGRLADVVIVAAGGDSDAYKNVAHFLRPRGRLMVVGLPPNTRLDIPILFIAGKVI